MKRLHFTRSVLIPLLLSLAACGGGGGGGGSSTPTPTTGELTVGVTDAAVDSASMVLVQFTGVTVMPKEGTAIDLPLDGDSQTCEELLNGVAPHPAALGEASVRCIDLLSLQGTASITLLDGAVLEAGEYVWMRLDVDAQKGVMDSIIVLDDGAVESLYVPSGSQSGLKLNTGFTILAGGTHDFVIDFDLRKSVNNPQGFPDYMLKPSLRLIDRSLSGNIVGSVDASLLQEDYCTPDAYAVYVYQGGNLAETGEEGSAFPPLTSAAVTLQGNQWRYTVGFLPPGEYTAMFTCEAGNDTEAPEDGITFVGSPDNPATVVDGEDTEVNFSP